MRPMRKQRERRRRRRHGSCCRIPRRPASPSSAGTHSKTNGATRWIPWPARVSVDVERISSRDAVFELRFNFPHDATARDFQEELQQEGFAVYPCAWWSFGRLRFAIPFSSAEDARALYRDLSSRLTGGARAELVRLSRLHRFGRRFGDAVVPPPPSDA